MKEVKQEWKESRMFQGKVSPTAVALGKTSEDEYRTNSHLISKALNEAKGNPKGLFFTNSKPDKVLPWFANHKVPAFPKAGFVAIRDFIVKKGILTKFSFSQETTLRQLGLPVILNNGRIILKDDHTICQRGQPLRPEQCKLLQLFNDPQAHFSINLYGYWTNNEYFEINSDPHNNIENVNDNNNVDNNTNDDHNNKDNNDNNDIDINNFVDNNNKVNNFVDDNDNDNKQQ